jgi:simple sugar transport system permease protein
MDIPPTVRAMSPDQTPKAGLWHRLTTSKSFWPLVALIALFVFNILLTKGFAHIEIKGGRLFGAPIDILHRGSRVMLLAVGMTLVIATAGIDLSVGAVMAVAGAVAALLLTRQPSLVVPGVVAIALLVAFAAGLWNGVLVAFLGLQPIVATLILLVAGRGIAQLLTDGQIITFENPAFESIGRGTALYLPITVFIVAGVVALTLLVTKTTIAGLYIEAVGSNERASRLSGIRPGLVKMLVYGFSGLCAGMAGLIETADIKAADINNCGLYFELDAILAVVIGGTPFSGGRANVIGSIFGALIMQTLTTTILLRGVDPSYTLVVKAITVIIVCLLQSEQLRATILAAVGLRRRA